MAILSPHLIISNTGDISVTRGVDVAFSVTFKANDVAVDLTGYTVYFTVRKNQDVTDADDSEAIISQEYTSIANPATGIVNIALSKTELKQNVGEYFYGIDFKNGSGTVTKGFEGKFSITYNSANRTS
jgi:hypothetical protein